MDRRLFHSDSVVSLVDTTWRHSASTASSSSSVRGAVVVDRPRRQSRAARSRLACWRDHAAHLLARPTRAAHARARSDVPRRNRPPRCGRRWLANGTTRRAAARRRRSPRCATVAARRWPRRRSADAGSPRGCRLARGSAKTSVRMRARSSAPPSSMTSTPNSAAQRRDGGAAACASAPRAIASVSIKCAPSATQHCSDGALAAADAAGQADAADGHDGPSLAKPVDPGPAEPVEDALGPTSITTKPRAREKRTERHVAALAQRALIFIAMPTDGAEHRRAKHDRQQSSATPAMRPVRQAT